MTDNKLSATVGNLQKTKGKMISDKVQELESEISFLKCCIKSGEKSEL